jgi:hypothetical protein
VAANSAYLSNQRFDRGAFSLAHFPALIFRSRHSALMFSQCRPASRKSQHIENQLVSALLSDRISAARSAARLKLRRVSAIVVHPLRMGTVQ